MERIAELSDAERAWLEEAEGVDLSPSPDLANPDWHGDEDELIAVAKRVIGLGADEVMTVPPPMTTSEARGATELIKSGLVTLRQLFLDVYEREGWKALGYISFVEYAEKEFAYGKSHAYRLIDAATVERNLRHSPMGEKDVIPERVLRPLAKLEPSEQREAYAKAVYLSPDGKPKAADTQAAAKAVRPALAKPTPTAPVYTPPVTVAAPEPSETVSDILPEVALPGSTSKESETVAEPHATIIHPEWVTHVLSHYDPINADFQTALGMATFEQLGEAYALVPAGTNKAFADRRAAIRERMRALNAELAAATERSRRVRVDLDLSTPDDDEAAAVAQVAAEQADEDAERAARDAQRAPYERVGDPVAQPDPRIAQATALREQLAAVRIAVNNNYSGLCGKWVDILGWYRGCEKMMADLDALIAALSGEGGA